MKTSILVPCALAAAFSVASPMTADDDAKFQTYHLLGKLDRIKLTNNSKTIIGVAESPPPFSSDSVRPGETLSLTLKDFSHQMVIRKLRGTAPGPERIEFDVILSFDEDIDWPGGIHFGVVYVAEMHKHPEWFHISTRQRSWKKSQKKGH